MNTAPPRRPWRSSRKSTTTRAGRPRRRRGGPLLPGRLPAAGDAAPGRRPHRRMAFPRPGLGCGRRVTGICSARDSGLRRGARPPVRRRKVAGTARSARRPNLRGEGIPPGRATGDRPAGGRGIAGIGGRGSGLLPGSRGKPRSQVLSGRVPRNAPHPPSGLLGKKRKV